LIAVGARQSLSLPFAMSLAERLPLEERILAMTMVRPSRPTIASAPFVALGIIAVAAVANAPVPAPLVKTTHANTSATARVAQHPAGYTAITTVHTPPSEARPLRVVRAVSKHASAPAKTTAATGAARHRVTEKLGGVRVPAENGGTQTITGSFFVDSRGAMVADSSRNLVNLQHLKSDNYPTALFVPRSVDGLATKAGADSAPFSMVGDLTVHGVTRPVKWIGSARSTGDTVHGTARTAFSFEDFGLVSPHTTKLPSVKDSIRLEYDFDFVTVKQ
jgi:polyisoprenoid-binding protein YceI